MDDVLLYPELSYFYHRYSKIFAENDRSTSATIVLGWEPIESFWAGWHNWQVGICKCGLP